MTPLSLPTLVMAGVSLYVGVYHLAIHVRRKNHPEDLSFAILCLSTALYEVLSTGLYNAATAAEGGQWQRLQFISLALFVSAFLWFVMDYTGRRLGPVVYGFMAFYLLAIVVQIADRSDLTWISSAPSVKVVSLPFGARVTYHEVALGLFSMVQGLVGLVATAYMVWCGIRFARQGHRREAAHLLVALGVMTVAGVNDTCVSDGLYSFLYLIEYGYLAMIVLMASSLSGAVVDAAIVQEDLRQAELVIDNSPVVLFRWGTGAAWPVEYVSANVRQFGYSQRELLSGEVPYASFVHPDDLARVAQEVDAYVAGGAVSFSQDYRIVTKGGAVRWVDDRTIVIRDASGRLLRLQGIVVDITDRRRVEEALRESEEKFRSIVENALVGIFTVNDAYRFIYCNDETCRIVGRSRETVLASDFRDFLAPESRPLVEERYVQRQQGREAPSRYEIDIVRSDGERRHLEMSVALVRDAAGRPRTMGQLVDVTERTRAQAEIKLLNEKLERRVTERTAELEAAVKELEAFTYSVSHDLRAPLRAMSGFARILLLDRADGLAPDASRYLATIHSKAQQMGRLIDDLLRFSRLNRQPVVRGDCSMETTAREALDSLAEERAGRCVEVNCGSLPPCQGDPGLLKQVWINLLSNAIKYTRGCATARIDIGSQERDSEVVYYVRDNGAGFDMRYADKLFGVFQRLHRDDEFEGTGIGLAIVKRIVTRHGGRVWAEATPGVGAAFYFAL